MRVMSHRAGEETTYQTTGPAGRFQHIRVNNPLLAEKLSHGGDVLRFSITQVLSFLAPENTDPLITKEQK